jgi:hypothetical protein
MTQHLDATIGELCFICGQCRDVIRNGQSQLIVQLSSARESWKSGLERVQLKIFHC